MTPQELDSKFQQLQQELPAEMEELAREHKAFQRARRIKSVSDLLRAVMLYSICDLSLRQIAGWFTGRGQRMSDEAVRGRLKCCAKWIEALLGKMMPSVKLPARPDGKKAWKLLVRDGSVVNGPGSQGTDYRLHLSFDPLEQKIGEFHVYDVKTGESLKLFEHDENTIDLGDRGFAKAPALIATRRSGAHFIVRMSPSYLALRDRAGNKFEVLEELRGAGDAVSLSFEVVVRDAKTGQTCEAYLHAHRLSEGASNKARRRVKRNSKKNGQKLGQQTLLLCDWLLVLTSIAPSELPAKEIFELYRVRWQVELLIKRFKSLLDADCLRALAGSPLAEVYLWGKLLFALLVERPHAQTSRPGVDANDRLSESDLLGSVEADCRRDQRSCAQYGGLEQSRLARDAQCAWRTKEETETSDHPGCDCSVAAWQTNSCFAVTKLCIGGSSTYELILALMGQRPSAHRAAEPRKKLA